MISRTQRKFSLMVAALICKAHNLDEEAASIKAQVLTNPDSYSWDGVTFGWAMRDEMANRRVGGVPRSKHLSRLAVDLNLFEGGDYLTASGNYGPLGEFWKSMGGTWGGDWENGDGNHFELDPAAVHQLTPRTPLPGEEDEVSSRLAALERAVADIGLTLKGMAREMEAKL